MKSEKLERIYRTIMLVILTATVTFIITSAILYHTVGGTNVKYITTDSIGKTFQMFHKFIEERYLGEMDENAMLESAIKGYVEGLNDEYSEYITKEEMQEYMQDAIGKYVGIGVYIANHTQTNQIIVLTPMKDSPAEKAGIKAGDIITKIDGKAYTGEELSEASNALKQEAGTKVQIEILRGEQVLTLEVETEEVKVSHVEIEILEGDIAYIQIPAFDEGCYEEFKQKWEEMQKNHKITSLIIDLRNNGGGIVDEALDIADMMVEKDKTLLIARSKQENEEISKAKEDKVINVPVVFLVNDKTASASEILAAAVKENNENTTIIGKTTYGKGIIQTIFTLTDGSGIKLTTNEYYTPNHNVIHKVGIKPDIEVELPEGEEDTQLQKAIEMCK